MLGDYRRQNRGLWDRYATSGSQFARVATDDECRRALEVLDGRGWLPATVEGMDVLCLASGGGWQSILYAVAGANVTVVDISPEMLALDQREAERRGLHVKTIEASMDSLTLADETFDIVHQPVSTCYVPSIVDVYREVARVMRDGGVYISQHKQPTSLQITHRDSADHYAIGVPYYLTGRLPPARDHSYRESGAAEYLHRWEDIVGGLARSGFDIEDLREPYRAAPEAKPGDFRHRGQFVPPYVRLKARRRARRNDRDLEAPSLWTPP